MNEMLAYLHENDKQADVNSAAYDAYYKMFTNYDAPDNIQNLNDMLFYGKAPKFEVIDYAENKKRPRNVYLVGKNDHKGWAKELEQQLCSMEAPVAVFLRRDFNELTLKELTDKYNDWLDYTVMVRRCSFLCRKTSSCFSAESVIRIIAMLFSRGKYSVFCRI